MPVWLSVILEIIKIATPALIVFAVVYFMMKQFFANELSVRQYELKRKTREFTIPLQLQAYERMALYLERIQLPKMILRLRTDSMKVDDLRIAILVALEQEYDHNVAQQVYMSDQMWQIVTMSKNEAANIASLVAKDMKEGANALEYSQAIFKYLDENPQMALRKAQEAIKEEAKAIL